MWPPPREHLVQISVVHKLFTRILPLLSFTLGKTTNDSGTTATRAISHFGWVVEHRRRGGKHAWDGRGLFSFSFRLPLLELEEQSLHRRQSAVSVKDRQTLLLLSMAEERSCSSLKTHKRVENYANKVVKPEFFFIVSFAVFIGAGWLSSADIWVVIHW